MIKRIVRAANLLSYIAAAVFFGSAQSAAAAPIAVPSSLLRAQSELPNMSEVAPNFYRGGQPNLQALRDLKDSGVKVDICLDNEREIAAQESMDAQAAGIRFVHIPMNPLHKPSDFDILRFLDIVSRKDEEPVYVHCVHGRDRTGAMVGIYRLVHDHWTPDAAYQEMMNRGFRPFFTHLSDAVFSVGQQLGMGGHKPTLGYIATHLAGHITPSAPIMAQ